MKIINVILALFISFSFLLVHVDLFAQSNLLPEKTTIATENINTSKTVVDIEKTQKDEQVAWASIVIVLMFVGLFLLFMEIAVIPGVGITGVSGTIILIVSLGLAFWKLSKVWAIGVTVGNVIGVILLVLFMFFGLPYTKLGKRLILLETAPNPDESYAVEDYKRFLEAEGIADSNLRPSGIAKIAGERVDVITEGGFIEKGTKIKVTKVKGGRVIVDAIEE